MIRNQRRQASRWILSCLVFATSVTTLVDAEAQRRNRRPANVEASAPDESTSDASSTSSGASTSTTDTSSATEERPKSSTLALLLNPPLKQSWRPKSVVHSLGIESSSASFGVLGVTSVVYGRWNGSKGWEALFAYNKTADSFANSSTTSLNTIANSQTLTETASGARNPTSILLGYQYKSKSFESDWLLIYWGALGAVRWQSTTEYDTGTKTTTTANTATPGDFTVTESARGSIKREPSPDYILGLRIGSEVYLRWFPNIALTFSTGFTQTLGGTVKQTTDTWTRTTPYTGGVAGAPSSASRSTQVTETPGNLSAATFGVGGQTFNLFGSWGIRYIW